MGPWCEQTHAAFEVGLSLDHGQGISSGWSDIDGSSQLRLCHTCIIDVMINHSHARDTQQTYEDMCVRSIYIPRILWEVITCSCPWYLLLAHKSSYFEWNIAACNSQLVLNGCPVGKSGAWNKGIMETLSILLALLWGESMDSGGFPL